MSSAHAAATESFNASSHHDATMFDALIYRQYRCSAHEGLSTLPSNCAGSVGFLHASSSLGLTQNIHPTVISVCLCRCECCMHLTVFCWVTASRNRSSTKEGLTLLERWRLTQGMAAPPQQSALPQVSYCCQGMNHSEKTCCPCGNKPAKSYRQQQQLSK